MDINFKCRHCDQDLSVEASGAGSEIQCPACGGLLIIPQPEPEAGAPAAASGGGPHIVNPISTSAAAREEKHFSVPQRAVPTESLITKPLRPLEAAAHEGIQLRIKCIRHFDCVEVGKDHFDEIVTSWLNKIGEQNIVKVDTFNCSHRDLETRDWITDYGVIILYKG